jgi:uncharacterized protein DUF3108
MKRYTYTSALILILCGLLPNGTTAAEIKPVPFAEGESLTYAIDYGPVNAGEATLKVLPNVVSGGTDCYRVESSILSNRVFSAMYRVRDKAVSHFSVHDLTSRYFSKRLREGDFRRNVQVRFDPEAGLATYHDDREYPIEPNTYDVLSATYQVRTMEMVPGMTHSLIVHSSRKSYELKVIVHGRETVKVPAGEFDCFIVEPIFKGEGLFQYEGKLTFWVTADERRIPVLIKTKVKVGAIEASLKDYTPGEPQTAGRAE